MKYRHYIPPGVQALLLVLPGGFFILGAYYVEKWRRSHDVS